MKRVWFTSPNDYLKQLAEFIQEVRFVLYFLYCGGRFLQTHGPLLGRLDRVVFAEFLRISLEERYPEAVLLDEGCENVWCLNQFVGSSSGNGG